MLTVIIPSLQGTPRKEPLEILWSTTTIVLTVIEIPESQGTPRKEPLKEPKLKTKIEPRLIIITLIIPIIMVFTMTTEQQGSLRKEPLQI